MADEKKAAAAEPKEVAESTAFKDGKLQSGYGYRYETIRNADGKRETRKVVFKVGS